MKGTRKLKRILTAVTAIAAMTTLFSVNAMAVNRPNQDQGSGMNSGEFRSPGHDEEFPPFEHEYYSGSHSPKLWIIEERTEHNYVKGSGVSVTITCNGEYSQFRSVYVDGIFLESTNYTVKEGSTVLTLMPEYLETLPVGTHTVTLNYTYGSVDSILNVLESNSNSEGVSANTSAGNGAAPKTGDASALVFWSMAALASGCVLTRRKRTDIR